MSLETLLNEYTAARKIFHEKAQSAMKASFREIFEKYPEITAFRWVQYTPYFNDGEPCEFRVGDVAVTNIPLDSEEFQDINAYGDYDGESDRVSSYKSPREWFSTSYGLDQSYFKNDIKDLKDLITSLNSSAMEEVLQGTFGDHVYVTVTRNGIEVEDFEHD